LAVPLAKALRIAKGSIEGTYRSAS
jgi:hypothetical protein